MLAVPFPIAHTAPAAAHRWARRGGGVLSRLRDGGKVPSGLRARPRTCPCTGCCVHHWAPQTVTANSSGTINTSLSLRVVVQFPLFHLYSSFDQEELAGCGKSSLRVLINDQHDKTVQKRSKLAITECGFVAGFTRFFLRTLLHQRPQPGVR